MGHLQNNQPSGDGKQVMFNNFFANPDDDIRDIYNDSSDTNNSNSLNNPLNLKHQIPTQKFL